KRREGAHGLCRQCTAIDEEQHATRGTRLHEPVDLVHARERLARAGRHGDQKAALSLCEGLLFRSVRVLLVWAAPRGIVRHRGEWLELCVEVPAQELGECLRRVELCDSARAVQRVTHVMEPDHLSVRRVEKRNAKTTEVER